MLAREIRVLLLVLVAGAAGLIALVQYTDICRLQAVTLNGQKVSRVEDLGLTTTRPILLQPVDSLADVLMTRQGITKVEIDYKLPNALWITTNSLAPVCHLLDTRTGGIYGLEETGRVVPVRYEDINWEAPLFTGVAVKRLHEFPADGRVIQILRQMQQLRAENPRLFAQIEEVDLSRQEYAMLTLANKPYRLRLRSEQFADRYREFDQFMGTFRPETDSVTSFDLTYADMIVRVGYVEPKEKPVIDTSEVNDKAQFMDENEMLQQSIAAEMATKKAVTVAAAPKPKVTPAKSSAHKSVSKTPGKKPAAVNKNSKSGSTSKAGKTSSKNTKNGKSKPAVKPANKTGKTGKTGSKSKTAKNG